MTSSLKDPRTPFFFQTCTEMVIPLGVNTNDTMFQFDPFDLNKHASECQEAFGVTPRPNWIATNFGGHVSFQLPNFIYLFFSESLTLFIRNKELPIFNYLFLVFSKYSASLCL